MANLIWTYNGLVVDDAINLGGLEHLQESQVFDITIAHDSSQEISGCGFYISPYTKEYNGSFSPNKDYERLLWMANNYPGYGLSIRQIYEVTGQIDGHDGIRLIDFDREERTDIFKGSTIEILSGDAVGETAVISSYNPATQLFILSSDFSSNVIGSNYKILIDREIFFKSGQGASYDTLIPLIHKGGVIERFDQVNVSVRLRIPKFAQSAGKFLFDLKMQYTSLEES